MSLSRNLLTASRSRQASLRWTRLLLGCLIVAVACGRAPQSPNSGRGGAANDPSSSPGSNGAASSKGARSGGPAAQGAATPGAFCYKGGKDPSQVSPECAALPDQPPDQPLITGKRWELLSWDRATAWWPYRPIFRWEPMRPSFEEAIYAYSNEGGTHGDPSAVTASLDVFYQIPPDTVEKHSIWRVMEAGGFTVSFSYWAPGETAPVLFYSDAASTDHQVTVRGHSAWVHDMHKPRDNRDSLRIQWNEARPNGGTLFWRIGVNPLRYSEQQTIDFINSLRETS